MFENIQQQSLARSIQTSVVVTNVTESSSEEKPFVLAPTPAQLGKAPLQRRLSMAGKNIFYFFRTRVYRNTVIRFERFNSDDYQFKFVAIIRSVALLFAVQLCDVDNSIAERNFWRAGVAVRQTFELFQKEYRRWYGQVRVNTFNRARRCDVIADFAKINVCFFSK